MFESSIQHYHEMKTIIPTAITSVEEAKAFLKSLHDNGEEFHPEDPAASIINGRTGNRLFADEEAVKVDQAVEQIYNIDGFDPCEYLLELSGHIIEN